MDEIKCEHCIRLCYIISVVCSAFCFVFTLSKVQALFALIAALSSFVSLGIYLVFHRKENIIAYTSIVFIIVCTIQLGFYLSRLWNLESTKIVRKKNGRNLQLLNLP